MDDLNRQEDLRAARRRKTLLLVVGGAVAVAIPLAGLLYQRIKAMSIGGPGDWRPGFDSRTSAGAPAPVGDSRGLGEAERADPGLPRQSGDSVSLVEAAATNAGARKPRPAQAAPALRKAPPVLQAPSAKMAPRPQAAASASSAYQIPRLPKNIMFSNRGKTGALPSSGGGIPFRNGSPINGAAGPGRGAGQLPSTVLQGPSSGN